MNAWDKIRVSLHLRGDVDVTVKEHKFSFASEFDITAGEATYFARKAVLAFNDHLEIKNDAGQVLATIQGFFSPIRGKHQFVMADQRTYQFQTEKLWKTSYSCVGAGASYTLYQHKGLRCSIFNGNRQIAAFEKNQIALGSGNEYDIQMDSDADLMVVVCMVLTINSEDYDDKQGTFTIDFGHIGPEARPLDQNWQPR